jgi:Uma2 family endonuclease
VELRSPSDSVKELKEKMGEYIENGAQLGWLIDPIPKHHQSRGEIPLPRSGI